MRKLIGLDMDGVMVPTNLDNADSKIMKTPIYFLNKVLECLPNVDILITSSWGDANNETTKLLVEAGFKFPERVIGYTDSQSIGNRSRTKEVEEWMLANSGIIYDNIICVDDCIEEFEYFSKYSGCTKHGIVLCEPTVGLDINNTYELISKLNGIELRYWG